MTYKMPFNPTHILINEWGNRIPVEVGNDCISSQYEVEFHMPRSYFMRDGIIRKSEGYALHHVAKGARLEKLAK